MIHLIFIVFLLISAALFALLEIQIEGKYGWAEKLPTWRIPVNPKLLIQPFMDPNQPQTGYHTFLWAFLLLILHFPFFFTKWTPRYEFIVFAFYILITTLEDFFWFLFNPAFGLKKFKKQYIKWQTYWFAGLPIRYWIYFPIGIIFYLIGTGVL